MKLHELARQVQALGLGTGSNATKEQQRAVLERLNIDWDSFYQEVEMDYPLVQTQQDVSETGDVVALHSHAYYEILFIRSGNLQYLIGTRRYRARGSATVRCFPKNSPKSTTVWWSGSAQRA